MCAGPAATAMRCSTQIVTCSNLSSDPFSWEANPVTSIEQRDVQSVLAGIDDLLPLIAKRAQATEELRRLPDETVAELDEVGFFKLLQPEQWGGLQCDPTLFYEAVRRIASACGSTGWVSSIIGVHNWHLALFDQQAQEEVWGDDSDRADLVVLRADGCGPRGRRRLPGQRVMELVLGLRPRHMDVRRRPGHQGRQAGRLRQLPDPARRNTRSTTSGTSSDSRAPAAIRWWSRTCSCRGTGSFRTSR